MISVPLYEYECKDCKERFEVFISMSETQKACIHCKSNKISKVVSSVGEKVDKNSFKTRTGDIVKKHIEDSKKDLKQEKEKLKETYK